MGLVRARKQKCSFTTSVVIGRVKVVTSKYFILRRHTTSSTYQYRYSTYGRSVRLLSKIPFSSLLIKISTMSDENGDLMGEASGNR